MILICTVISTSPTLERSTNCSVVLFTQMVCSVLLNRYFFLHRPFLFFFLSLIWSQFIHSKSIRVSQLRRVWGILLHCSFFILAKFTVSFHSASLLLKKKNLKWPIKTREHWLPVKHQLQLELLGLFLHFFTNNLKWKHFSKEPENVCLLY